MARLSHSTTRLLVPLSREFSLALLHSLRFHLKLYRIQPLAAAYSLRAFGQVLRRFTARDGSGRNAARVTIRASQSRFRMTLRLPAGRIAAAKLQARLPHPPPGVKVRLKGGKSGPLLSIEASIPGRD